MAKRYAYYPFSFALSVMVLPNSGLESIRLLSKKITPLRIGGSKISKPCAIGPVGFPQAERAVAERAVSF